jgi:sulfur carrier protein ThiS
VHVEVHFHPSGAERRVELPSSARGLDLLGVLELAPDAHLLVRGDAPVPEDEVLLEGDRIRVIAVVSGG